ncbi:UrcA family protein [Asticcacaulis solisilvae]|uniref:UrcA family protein n=1 Tax=Asticcacaulis solisilvae TaxID=1217274 RepID=UPI003FD74D94
MIRFIIASAIMSSAAFAGLAHAADDTVVETSVTTQGVDFNQPAQTARFYKALHVAAEKVCDVRGGDFVTQADNKDCRDRALDEAVRDTHDWHLSRLHEEAVARRDAGKVTQTASRTW